MKLVIIFMIAVVVVIALLLLKRANQTPIGETQEKMKHGAVVIDVRSPEEFRSGHLSAAINIPLNEIESALPLQVKDKDQVLLLYCQSGMRSTMAAKKLKGMGYTNASNLGSMSRARKIVGDVAP